MSGFLIKYTYLCVQDLSYLLETETEPETCKMECGCCFADTDLLEMVQCSEGHLFCMECLRRYANEAIHGQGKVRHDLVFLIADDIHVLH